jgi:hypothetical protein
MRPRARALLVALTLAIPIPLLATPSLAVGAAVSPAQFSQSAASKKERLMFGSELMGKVTRAGKVGNIDANIGDLVLREAQVPGNRGARAALGPATVQAATVLHGVWDRDNYSSSYQNYKIVVAVQENQSKQVRAYAKGHLYWTPDGPLVATYHRLSSLWAWNFDYDSAGDGCGPYPTGSPCFYQKNPGNAEPPNAVLDYYALGTYRHKCGQEGWNCDNAWAVKTRYWTWWDEQEFQWDEGVVETCSRLWRVLYGAEPLAYCNDW